MSNQPRVTLDRLELNRETIRDLTEQEAENVRGGGLLVGARPSAGAWSGCVDCNLLAAPRPSLVNPTDPITRG